MRILMINKRPPYRNTGAEKVLWGIARKLVEAGHSVTIFCPTPADRESETHPEIDFRYVSTGGGPDRSMIEFFLKGPRTYPSVYRDVSPDLVYDNPSPFPFHLAHLYGDAQRITKLHGIYRRLAFSCKDHPLVKVGTAVGDELYRLFRGEVITTNSLSTAHRARQVFTTDSNRIIANPIGIDAAEYTFSIRSDEKHVLSLSELRTRKQINVLLRAWKYVESAHPDARLTVAGDGQQRDSLERLATDLDLETVTFEGWVTEERKHELLASAAIYALPTLYEGFGLANLEAMASGCAVVSTDTWGVRDYLRDGENGRLVPTKDPPALATVIDSLLSEPAQIERLATAGRETAAEYSMAESITREVRLLEQIHEDGDMFAEA
ncbi:Glycosyltransferase [Halorhabdus sp. BNX81]|nr:Glycosyltransferase [Halorhabdus sp. BNX81]